MGLPYIRLDCEEVYPRGARVTRRPALLPRERGRALSDGAPSHLYPLSETLPCAPASGSSSCSSNGGGDGGGGGHNSDIMLPSFGQHLQLQPTVLSPQRQLVFLTMQRHDEIRVREVWLMELPMWRKVVDIQPFFFFFKLDNLKNLPKAKLGQISATEQKISTHRMCFPSMIIIQLLTSNSSTFSHVWVKPGLEIFYFYFFLAVSCLPDLRINKARVWFPSSSFSHFSSL